MDILRPPTLWVGNRCYRVNPLGNQSGVDYAEEDDYYMSQDEYADEVCDTSSNVEKTDSGYRLKLQVPSAFYGFLIGRGGETKRRLESETNTQIKFPRAGHEGDVVINGTDRKGVISAETRLNILVDTAKSKQPFTHFLSIPVCSENFKQNLEEFKASVLAECGNDQGVDETIFQNPLKLHLTLGTMVLMNHLDIEKAQAILRTCFEEKISPILDNKPLYIHFKGLEYMNDDPSAVDVIYAKCNLVDHSTKLQNIADILTETFKSAGIMKKDFDRVKLHATVMNSLMRKDSSGTLEPRSRTNKPREAFNASNILQHFGDFDFGIHEVQEIHISQKLATKADGYYGCEYALKLNRQS